MPHTIHLDGHPLTYDTYGDPQHPPLLMLHGWFSHRGVWRTTWPVLQDRYYCVPIDLLGFGDSAKPEDADYGIPAQGQRVLQLADAMGWKTFSLIGHSMGGQTALTIAARLAPERVRALVNVAGVVAGRLQPRLEYFIYPLIALWYRFPGLGHLLRQNAHWPWYAKNVTYRNWFYNMEALPFAAWAIDRDMASQFTMRVSAYKAGQAIHALNLTSELGKITAPVLTIFGQQDGTVPVRDGQLVKQALPQSELVLIESCGHFPMYEKPAVYVAAVQKFLNR